MSRRVIRVAGALWVHVDDIGNAFLSYSAEQHDGELFMVQRADIAPLVLELSALVPQPDGMMTGTLTADGWEPDDDGAAAIAALTAQVEANAAAAAAAAEQPGAGERLERGTRCKLCGVVFDPLLGVPSQCPRCLSGPREHVPASLPWPDDRDHGGTSCARLKLGDPIVICCRPRGHAGAHASHAGITWTGGDDGQN